MINKLKKLKHAYLRYRLFQLLNKLGILKVFNVSFKLKIRNRKFHIPVFHGIGHQHLVEQENWMIEVLKKALSENGNKTFLDIGVNIGQTLLKAKSLNDKIEYIGFEPNPHCVYYTNILIESNKLHNCRIIPAALTSQNSHLELYLPNPNSFDSSASIVYGFRKNISRVIDVIGIVSDTVLMLQNKEIGIIKIDVEGAELEVLNSLEKIILKNKPIIIIEILPVYNIENNTRLQRQLEIETLLKKWNYVIKRINISDNSQNEINEIGIHDDLNKCNYILIPKK